MENPSQPFISPHKYFAINEQNDSRQAECASSRSKSCAGSASMVKQVPLILSTTWSFISSSPQVTLNKRVGTIEESCSISQNV